jgi:hypothetical protein
LPTFEFILYSFSANACHFFGNPSRNRRPVRVNGNKTDRCVVENGYIDISCNPRSICSSICKGTL